MQSEFEYSLINLTCVTDLYDMINNNDFSSHHLKIQPVLLDKETNASEGSDGSYSYSYNYKIIRYLKEFLTPELIPTYGLFRSVILNKKNEFICFSPPKSIPADIFIEKYSIQNLFVVVEEFIEGTMINLFWDEELGIWELATRNTVGANTYFFKNNNNGNSKTFRIMFLEACIENNVNISLLNKNYCYSFILQHPENRIVIPFVKPELYLIAVYRIVNININDNNINDKKEVIIKSLHLDKIENLSNKVLKIYLGIENTGIKFPQKIDTTKTSYSELIKMYASMNMPYDNQGIIIYNKLTGERIKIRNPVYEEVRQLRGNQPKLQYQYLVLRHQGKVSQFLKFYPENKKDFSNYRDQVHLFTNNLYNNYISCYIKKEKTLKEFPEQFRTHMYNLHQKYLNELREIKGFITNTIVKKFVNDLKTTRS
jgi:hypothetical protein